MRVTVDPAGRIMIPKSLRAAAGIKPGTKVDVSAYGGGLTVIPELPDARLERDQHGFLVIAGSTVVSDEQILALRDEFRR
ncbi:MAG: AbrB/MazE/SpoVT family DNA-binding domain-containing protein [Bifidobacteriaceae bacterium]|jgi:AbrB family looped-hinge helix DNA binding protein|nr:AbrB/MazE/SpoVT family DNA-binding domain-containing protein [Bifidobacteriaceae bacterium]